MINECMCGVGCMLYRAHWAGNAHWWLWILLIFTKSGAVRTAPTSLAPMPLWVYHLPAKTGSWWTKKCYHRPNPPKIVGCVESKHTERDTGKDVEQIIMVCKSHKHVSTCVYKKYYIYALVGGAPEAYSSRRACLYVCVLFYSVLCNATTTQHSNTAKLARTFCVRQCLCRCHDNCLLLKYFKRAAIAPTLQLISQVGRCL